MSEFQLQRTGPRPSFDALAYTCSDLDQHNLSFGTIASFAGRARDFYQALQEISAYLPPQGEASIQAMQFVTEQRKWMYDVGCAVGYVVGTFYQLEKNTLSELEVMWRTGQEQLTVKQMKKNFKATADNLTLVSEWREMTLQKIEECERMANQMVRWGGPGGAEQKIQHATMEFLGKFGGKAQCEALLEELKVAHEAYAAAQVKEVKAAKDLQGARAEEEEWKCKVLVYESIASDEKGSLERLAQRAKDWDEKAAQKSEVAANLCSTPYRSPFLFFWWRDWESNGAARADERATKFKRIAAEAKTMKGDQQERAKEAAEEAGYAKGKHANAAERVQRCLAVLRTAGKEVQQARTNLLASKESAKELRAQYGNIDLQHIASLRDHLQHFPAMLSAQGTQDNSMFASMKGALLQHKRLIGRMQTFLNETDDQECTRLLHTLRETVAAAIKQSTFFQQAMAPLKDLVVSALPPPDTNATAWAAPPAAAGPAAAGPAATPVLLTLTSAEDADTLW